MVRLAGRFGRFFPLACVAFCSVLWAAAGIALADEPPAYSPPSELSEPPAPEGQPSCPVLELEPFEGEDQAAGETRLLRGELAEVCSALSARLDRVRERGWWAVAEAVKAAAQRAQANERLAAIEKAVCSAPCSVEVTGSRPVEVQDAAGAQYNETLASAVDSSGEASKVALWFIAGLLVAGVVAFALYKTVDRGT